MEIVDDDYLALGGVVQELGKILAVFPRQTESLAKSGRGGNCLGQFAGNVGFAGSGRTGDDDVLVLPYQRHVSLDD